jgi:trigger factor
MGLESLTQLKERLRTGLEAERARREREDLEHQIIDGLLNLHPFDVPASLVERRSLELTERMKTFLLSRGASEAEWAKNEPSMKEKNRTEAERQIRLSYLLVEIAQKEGIQASDSDVDAAVAKSVKESAAEKAEDVRKWLEERRESLRAQVKEEKIFTFLIEKAQVTEEPAA